VITPTSRQVVVTEPGYKPPDILEGGEVKDQVQELSELVEKLKNENKAFAKSKGAILADRAYGSLQEPLKQQSPAYTAKMAEINAKMKVLSAARKSFPTPKRTLGQLRRIGGGRENSIFEAEDLDAQKKELGTNYTDRIKDQITLDAFTKPGVQGSRAVNAGRAAGGAVGGQVGETVGAGIGATFDFYGRRILKKGIDLQRRIQYMPPKYKASFDRAVQKGGNAAAVMHHTLFAKDPEYRRMMQEMDEQQEQ
jgi:hypothetical protein